MVGRDAQGPRNDPTCPLYADTSHVCADKFSQVWDRENVGPRAGTHCALVDLNELHGEAIDYDDVIAYAKAHGRDPYDAHGEYKPDVISWASGELEHQRNMAELGALLASTMDDPDDEDQCGMVLG